MRKSLHLNAEFFPSKGEHMNTITVHVIAITSVVINGILFNMWLFK